MTKFNVLKHTILAGNDVLAATLGESNNTTVVIGILSDIWVELEDWLK